MTRAIDIDGTWTLDPETSFKAACLYRAAGWTVILVSLHEQPPDKLRRLRCLGFPFYSTGGQLKRPYMESLGLHVDVWEDNEPGVIEPCRILRTETTDGDL